jgi:PTS system nitrogen regulatory IIA component
MGQSLLDLITPDRILARVHAADKDALIADLAARAGRIAGVDPAAINAALGARERLSSTGVGAGVALPHAQVAGLPEVMVLLARLDQPIEFAAHDEFEVDLVVVVLAPDGAVAEQLKVLAKVARILRDRSVADRLRQVRDAAAMHAVLADAERNIAQQ